MRNTIFFLIAFCFATTSFAQSQLDTIVDQGQQRVFITHIPQGYSPANKYPIVLNMHGLGSNAIEQYLYSQFHTVADLLGFIVVYPDAINNAWDMFESSDIIFLNHLIDTIRSRYSTNDCVFSMGMSQGGFMSYKVACESPIPVEAIASVTGNMILPWFLTCTPDDTPLMQFHGTADAVVPYTGTFGIPHIEETINWWVNGNGCNATPFIDSIADINTSDNTTAIGYYYGMCDDNADVLFYKIINGGHTWPGAFPFPDGGHTNQDINASMLIGEFFNSYCSFTTSSNEPTNDHMSAYPNPVDDVLYVDQKFEKYSVIDLQGRIVILNSNVDNGQIHCASLPHGIYAFQLMAAGQKPVTVKVVKN